MPYLVTDAETVADTTLWTPPKQEEPGACTCTIPPAGLAKHKRGCPSQKKIKPVEDIFPPLYAHRPIAVAMLVLDDNLIPMPGAFGVFGTSTYGDNERALLTAWSNYMDSLRPIIVSFNGRGFDLPVLALRCMRFGVSLQWYGKDYRHRYDGDHIDLFDQLTEFGAVQRQGFSLDNMAQLIGLPAKGDAKGSSVAKLWAEKQVVKIEAYCLSDVAKTAFLFMRASLLRGRITLEQYRTAAGALFNMLTTALGQSSGLFGADPKILMLEE